MVWSYKRVKGGREYGCDALRNDSSAELLRLN